MSRCIVCDYCSEIDGSDGRSFEWNKKENGYVCGYCRGSIWEAANRFPIRDGEVPILERPDGLELPDGEDDLKEVAGRGLNAPAGEDEDIHTDDPGAAG